tara:strand:- start:428 stop:841 length:414 start_codon:yes stop_codon:yes gene_type:complete
MAKKTTKKKFSFSNVFKVTKSQKQDIATGKFSGSKAPKNSAKDDFLMDIGVKERNQAYFRDLEDRTNRSQQAMKEMQERINKGDGRPRGETAAERAARLKKEALEKRKAEGKERRKKFYKQKDERLAKLKAKLLNLA